MHLQFFQQEKSTELNPFPHIIELATRKISTVQLNSLKPEAKDYLRLLYVVEGKYEWVINGQTHLLFPGDFCFILPGQIFGSTQGILDIGVIAWLNIHVSSADGAGRVTLGEWSHLSEAEKNTISKILLMNNSTVITRCSEAGNILQDIQKEIATQEVGYISFVSHLIDNLFILIARQLTKQNNSRRDFPQAFMKLEEALRDNLSHQWTVEEMAALVGLGTTAFTEKVRRFTGFSPLNYLINIRISEAIKLLKRADVNLTDIALDVGFYSSQHFSTTFKKLTGYTPSQFRKNNLPNHQ